MRRRLVLSLVFILVAAGGGLGSTLAAGWGPVLGLDLQGGASVVLEPVEDVESDALDQAIEIIRNRVDALGVAEPDIARQGDSVIVQLPGVDEQQRALDLVGETAELRFRPVLEVLPPETDEPEPTTTTTTTATTDATEPAEEATTTTTTTTAPPDSTDREADDPDAVVVLPAQEDDEGGPPLRYRLGPAALRGDAVAGARAIIPDGFTWQVLVEFTGEGNEGFNQLAQQCVAGGPECPAGVVGQNGAVAIVLDGEVVSAPTIQEASFQGEATITGQFTEGEAKDLALVLRYGALPVQLEPLTTQSVSATLGRDSLRAGVIAGVVGVVVVALYLLSYYRLLGLVGILSLIVSGCLLWSIIAVLGEQQGLALTLAGITGIIVSLGVAVDSNIVYYERVKEDALAGRSLRAAADRGFKRAFSTILRADFTSLIGAALLYYFTVGPVRGFAFYLGLSTLIDIVTSWFFMRPAVILLARNRRLGRPRLLGIPRADATPAPAGGTA